MRKLFLSLIILVSYVQAWSQIGNIKGIVSNSATRERLPGATVKVANSTSGTVTDLQGEFFLREKPGTVVLQISYIGFKSIE
jgi:hypothetical protein